MKGLKLYALLGSLAFASACALPDALAEKSNSSVKKPESASSFDELSARTERSMRLDELFECFKKEQPKPTNTVARLTPDNPLGHSTLTQDSHRVPVKRVTTAHNTGKTVPVAHKKNLVPTVKPAKLELDENSLTVLAKYNHTSVDNNIVAVSNAVSHSATDVITANLDRASASNAVPKYKAGEQMVVKVTAHKDCNIIVFDYDSHGQLTQLFPNDYEKDGTVHSGETIEVGGANSKYTLDVSGKGTERIFVYAYPASEGQITLAMNPVANTPFRSAELNIDQYRRLVSNSKEYFSPATSSERTVSVKAKSGVQPVADSHSQQANKVELLFQIDSTK